MGDIDVRALLVVVALGAAAPLLAAALPGPRVPAVVLEIGLGILVGPVLGLVTVDDPVAMLALIGLAMLLFLAGLELDPGALGGPLLRRVTAAFAATAVLAGWPGSCSRRSASWAAPCSSRSRCARRRWGSSCRC